MVQFKIGLSGRARHHNHWKLTGRHSFKQNRFHLKYGAQRKLNDRHYAFRPGTTIHRLYELLARAERGLISYEKINVTDLKTIILRRKLADKLEGQTKKADLIQFLEREDDETVFEGLLKLPTELRTYIYTLYFEDFDSVPSPVQLPITMINRQIRQESLPLFYSTCTFEINIHRFIGSPSSYEGRAYLYELSKDSYTEIPEQYLGMIRRMSIRASADEWRETSNNAKAACVIDLGNQRKAATVTDFKLTGEYERFRHSGIHLMGMEAAICGHVAEIDSRIEGKGLRLEDIVRIVQAADLTE